MGSDNSNEVNNTKFLPQTEINRENSYFLRDLYLKYKNSDGYIDLMGLSRMTNNLIDKSTLCIILKICSSKENKLKYNDFVYFYALLKTKRFSAKMNFILYFIFPSNPSKTKNNYISQVNYYYKHSYTLSKILLDENIINKDIITKENVFNYIKENFKQEIEDYQLNKEICNLVLEQPQKESNIIDKNIEANISRKNSFNKHIMNNPKNYCQCLSQKNSVCSSIDYYRMNSSLFREYDSIRDKFEEYKRNNNGIFPLSLFQEMLNEINIAPSLIDLISNFIKRKAQKEIISFELFKEILSILTIPLDEEDKENNKQIFTDGIFLLFSYPNDYIEKTDFCSFIQLTKNDYSLQSINNILNKYEITKKITKTKFIELVDYLINELIESLEHIKYIPYIFFEFNLNDKKIEKHCIDILLNGKEIKDYIIQKMQTENIFYIINSEFWENWNKLVNNQNIEELENLKIQTESISDVNGKLNEGLVYLNDYIVLTKRIYNLFCKWYGRPNVEIEREKIVLEEENNLFNIKLNKDYEDPTSLLQYEDEITHKKYEIEINPIFLMFLNFEEVQIRCNNSLEKFKEQIKFKLENPNLQYYKFSRKEKFYKLFKVLQESLNIELDENNTRLWIFYQNIFEIVEFKDSLEKKGIFNKAVILLEINKNGIWPMDEFDPIKKEIKQEQQSILPVGIINLGNSCYMNSVLQIFLNIKEIKDIFVNIKLENKKFLNFLINYKSNKSLLVEVFINLLIEKWIEKKKTLSPKKFKAICGRINDNFRGNFQQDANDFFNFLIQSLHEGTNIKTIETDIVNKEEPDTTENELGNEYWANTIRNNASYIYDLFIGQLQSKLICSHCKKSKIKYEPYSILDLPIPEEKNIILFVKLFRLPYKLSPFFNNNKNTEANEIKIKKIKLLNYQNKNELKQEENNNIISKKGFDISINEQVNIELENSKKLKNLKNNSKDELITNELNLNIPIKLKIEIARNEQCEEIISTLKSMKELSLDTSDKYTKFIIICNGRNIEPYFKIDETLQSFNQIEVYELLNFEGLKNIFHYNDLLNEISSPRDIQTLNSPIKMQNDYHSNNFNNYGDKGYKEILIELKHRVRKNFEGDDYLIHLPIYYYLPTNRDFIILSNKKSIKIYDLYEMIWEKYMYFCDIPSKIENNLWWRNINNEIINNENNENINKRFCSPFILKVVNQSTFSCAYCPWFRLCNGCILDPNHKEYISLPENCFLIIEWCRRIKIKQIKDENILLCLNHSSLKNNQNIQKNFHKNVSIYDCFDLFTQKEILEDVFCEKCGEKRTFEKILKIERIPKYLVISLKRFKYTTIYRSKLKCPIKFPLNNINLSKYLIEESHENSKVYDLFGVINHFGDLQGGHYHSIIKIDNKWVKFNDSDVSYFTKIFDTQESYILVYKYIKDENNYKNFKFNFKGLMDTAFRIYIKQKNFEHIFNYLTDIDGEIVEEYENNCLFYYGEPVIVDKEKGYLINISQIDNEVNAIIKCNKGYLNIKYETNKIIKETVKDNYAIKNIDNNTVICGGGCKIF